MNLREAILNDDPGKIEASLEQGTHVDEAIDGMSAVEFAITHERWPAAVKLVDEGADLVGKACRGKPIFHCVVGEGTPELVVAMLDNGANPNAPDEAGNMPLKVAERAGRTEIANILKARGAAATPSPSR